MKEYEDKIEELYGHRYEIEPCPVSIGVSCSKYEINGDNIVNGGYYNGMNIRLCNYNDIPTIKRTEDGAYYCEGLEHCEEAYNKTNKIK